MGWSWPEIPLKLQVTVKTDDEVLQLRGKVMELEARIAELGAELNRLEYRYRCECIINAELVDLCRANHVPFRAALQARPFDSP